MEQSKSLVSRLHLIDFRLTFFGSFSRSDIATEFGVRDEAVTRDVSSYKKEREAKNKPQQFEYDQKKRRFVATIDFEPIYPHDALSSLSGIASKDDIYSDSDPGGGEGVPVFKPRIRTSINTETLTRITRSIYSKESVSIKYFSNSGERDRVIVPHSITMAETNILIRAYCRYRKDFRNFSLGRMYLLGDGPTQAADEELAYRDEEWNRILTAKLVPHPEFGNKEFVKLDYNFGDNEDIEIKVRAAIAGYLFRLWNVDCTSDHSLRRKSHHLWLKNYEDFPDSIESMFMAPGAKSKTD
jgi:hypothetical protein